jgi:hypothetical protein
MQVISTFFCEYFLVLFEFTSIRMKPLKTTTRWDHSLEWIPRLIHTREHKLIKFRSKPQKRDWTSIRNVEMRGNQEAGSWHMVSGCCSKDRNDQGQAQIHFDIQEAWICGANPGITRPMWTTTLTSSSSIVSLKWQVQIKQTAGKYRVCPIKSVSFYISGLKKSF